MFLSLFNDDSQLMNLISYKINLA